MERLVDERVNMDYRPSGKNKRQIIDITLGWNSMDECSTKQIPARRVVCKTNTGSESPEITTISLVDIRKNNYWLSEPTTRTFRVQKSIDKRISGLESQSTDENRLEEPWIWRILAKRVDGRTITGFKSRSTDEHRLEEPLIWRILA